MTSTTAWAKCALECLRAIGQRLVVTMFCVHAFVVNPAVVRLTPDGVSVDSSWEYAEIDGTTYFAATSPDYGRELWATDGTASGTRMIKDIAPGVASSSPRAFARLGNQLIFAAEDPLLGDVLWRSDGTANGTVMIKDPCPAAFESSISYPVVLGTRVFFAARDCLSGIELWDTDGTALGTGLLKDIRPGPLGSVPSRLITIGSRLYFSADTESFGSELWTSDGTQVGTVLVKDIVPGMGSGVYEPGYRAELNGSLFFIGATTPANPEIWKTDGSAASTVQFDLDGSPLSSFMPTDLMSLNGTLFFLGGSPVGHTLWKSDGSFGGTTFVRQLCPGSSAELDVRQLSRGVTRVYFLARDCDGVATIWSSDGTFSGTTPVQFPPAADVPMDAMGFTTSSGKTFAVVRPYNQSPQVAHLWSFDEITNTARQRSFLPGGANSFNYPATLFGTAAGVYFSGANDSSRQTYGLWLYRAQVPEPGDLNGDGKPDIIWRHATNGDTVFWMMNGVSSGEFQFFSTLDPQWKIEGVADFDGDGHNDLVLRHMVDGTCIALHLVNGAYKSYSILFGLPLEWEIQAVADFNVDGNPDFLMRHATNGGAFVWYFKKTQYMNYEVLFTADPTVKVDGVGDFDIDGQPDLLFRDTLTGNVFVWPTRYANDSLQLTAAPTALATLVPSSWEVVQVADWNADGKPDLLFRNPSNGAVFVWYTNGMALGGTDAIAQTDPIVEIAPRP